MGEMRGEITSQRRYPSTVPHHFKNHDKMTKTMILSIYCLYLLFHTLSNSTTDLFSGFCPIFTNEGFIDWKPCNKSISICPNISYFSDDVYKCKFIVYF